MDIFKVATEVVSVGAGFGVSALIGNIVTTVTTKSGSKLVDKICIGIGTAVITGIVGDKVNDYIHEKAEKLHESFNVEPVDMDIFEKEEVDANE